MNAKPFFWLACGLAACGCASQQPASQPYSSAELLSARTTLDTALHNCTQTYGYSPRQAANIPEHALAPHELQWNQCAYDAVRTYEKANPKLAPMYESLITSYETMTDQITQGTLTRSERQAQTQQKLEAIKQAEQAEISAANLQQAQQNQQQQNVIDTIRMLSAPGFRSM
ncbi:MAG TPA: hypothetical protein VMA37_13410 [Acetobacteraceae bacterium]|nr:hypothetical protein [Acetobacteraceae bacterium]